MRTADVKGKTIERVEQAPDKTSFATRVWSIERIVFTDGSSMRFLVVETWHGDGYIVEGLYEPKRKQ